MGALGRIRNRVRHIAAQAIRRVLLAGWFRADFSYGMPADGHVKVLMCLWNRPERLAVILDMLERQIGTPGIDLYLWNNAKGDQDFYEGVLSAAQSTSSVVRSVSLVRTPFNLGSIARFYWARKLALRGYRGPIIVVDDDEDVRGDFLSRCLDQYEPDAVTAWWAFEVGETYWERTPARVGGPVDHIGPGGMVCSAEVFLDRAFFTDLPLKFWFLDDLWLTHYAKSVGLRLAKLDADVDFVLEETNQYPAFIGLKVEFHEYLKTRR